MKFHIDFPEASLGVKLNCNSESSFKPENLALLWNSMNLLLSANHVPVEQEFLKLWMDADFLPVERKKDLPANPAPLPDVRIEREFNDALHKLRADLHDASARATVYKHVFATALVSMRGIDRLVVMMRNAREILEIEATTATLISNEIAMKVPGFPHKSITLLEHEQEREAILALVFIAINADGQKHVAELSACRTIMIALGVTSVNNQRLGALTKQGISALVASITPAVLPTALLNILRLVAADQNVESRERKLIGAIAGKMSPQHVKSIDKLAMLELGRVFDLQG
ncbi:MAG TPA: hypothetical protein VJ001_13220 [Rhodocyclaceae bacterium]|nr:hypothetical protein [Rhodocyclaceae bacterium]